MTIGEPASGTIPDPLHDTSSAGVEWSHVNTAEAVPGVQTPLSWSVWADVIDSSFRQGYGRLHLLTRAVRRRVPISPDERFSGIFFGRAANNLTLVRASMRKIPGGDDTEQDYYGASAGTTSPRARLGIASRAAGVMLSIAFVWPERRLARLGARSERFWRSSLGSLVAADTESSRVIFERAVDEMCRGAVAQVFWSTHVGIVQARFRALLRSFGSEDLEMQLLAGSSATGELALTDGLWKVAQGLRSLDDFVAEFGFHGPRAGELSSSSWREDPAQLEELVSRYQHLPSSAAPLAEDRRRNDERSDALDRLLRGRDARARRRIARSYAAARRAVPAAAVPKASYLRSFDVARAAARRIGELLRDDGTIADADDVFFLIRPELATPPEHASTLVTARRARREEFKTLDVPLSWVGMPDPHPRTGPAPTPTREHPDRVDGLGVSPGLVVGKVQVVHDPTVETPEADAVLVCSTTDPSWATFFVLASAVVIDIGGALSHGAIIARELGLPCVINTTTGTRDLHDGDIVRVDGHRGTVEILTRQRGPDSTPTER